MALDRSVTYPTRYAAPNTAHPQGAFENETAPAAFDKSYLDKAWLNDWDGFFAKMLNNAAITPNGIEDNGTASQFFDALVFAIRGGRIVNSKPFNSGDLTLPFTETVITDVTQTIKSGKSYKFTFSVGVESKDEGLVCLFSKDIANSDFTMTGVMVNGASSTVHNPTIGGGSGFNSEALYPGPGYSTVSIPENVLTTKTSITYTGIVTGGASDSDMNITLRQAFSGGSGTTKLQSAFSEIIEIN